MRGLIAWTRDRAARPTWSAIARLNLADWLLAAFLVVEILALKTILSTSQIREIVSKHRAGDYTTFKNFAATGAAILLLGALTSAAMLLARAAVRPRFRSGQTLVTVMPIAAAAVYGFVLVASLINPVAVFGSVTALTQILLFFGMLTAVAVGLRRSRAVRVTAIVLLVLTMAIRLVHPDRGDRIELITSAATDGLSAYERFINFRQSEVGVPDDYRCTDEVYPRGYGNDIDQSAQNADAMARNDNYSGYKPDTIFLDSKCLNFLSEEGARGRWPEIRKSFELWLANRPDLQAYKSAGRPYPVILISAQGGGIYAAAHAALFLAHIQDACPSFAQHVFVVSSVSGGSVGSAIFSSSVAEDRPISSLGCPLLARTPGDHEERVARLLREDFLSPMIDSMLGPNLVNGLLTANVARWRRAEILASSFRDAWRRQNPEAPDLWSSGVAAAWRPDGLTPAMMFNVTEVATGRRTAITPFSSKSTANDDWPALSRHLGDALFIDMHGYKRGMTVGTAAVASARFPFVTPPANVPIGISDPRQPGGTVAAQLVDGGYADNSGAETLQEVVPLLQSLKSEVTIHVIAFAGDDTAERLVGESDAYPYMYMTTLPFTAQAHGELGAPVLAFARARSFHADLSLRTLEDGMTQRCRPERRVGCVASPAFIRMPIDPGTMGLPLGWTLSHANLAAIRAKAAAMGRCAIVVPLGGYKASEVGNGWLGARDNDIMKEAALIGYDEREAKAARAKGNAEIWPAELDALAKPGCTLAKIQQILSAGMQDTD